MGTVLLSPLFPWLSWVIFPFSFLSTYLSSFLSYFLPLIHPSIHLPSSFLLLCLFVSFLPFLFPFLLSSFLPSIHPFFLPSFSTYLSTPNPKGWFIYLNIVFLGIDLRNPIFMILTFSPRNTEATAWRACSGQAVNQSILQLLTRPGKLRHRVLSTSPTGDIARTIWRLLAHLVTKYCQMDSRAGGIPALLASSRTWISSIVSISLFVTLRVPCGLVSQTGSIPSTQGTQLERKLKLLFYSNGPISCWKRPILR